MTAPRRMSNDELRDEPVTDEALAVGLDVAATWAQQDRYDPHRPVLSQVVAEAIDRRGSLGRRTADREAEALREQVEAEHRATLREQARADDAEARVAHLMELLTTVERCLRNTPTLRLIDTTIGHTAVGVRRSIGGVPAR